MGLLEMSINIHRPTKKTQNLSLEQNNNKRFLVTIQLRTFLIRLLHFTALGKDQKKATDAFSMHKAQEDSTGTSL